MRKPLTDEEREQKVRELRDKAKRIREAKLKQAQEEEILREKDRRNRGKTVEKVSEEREKLMRQREFDLQRKEKEVSFNGCIVDDELIVCI